MLKQSFWNSFKAVAAYQNNEKTAQCVLMWQFYSTLHLSAIFIDL